MMQPGTQFTFTEDWGQFESSLPYIFAGHDRKNDRIAIIQIRSINNVRLFMLNRAAFESVIGTSVISINSIQSSLPPWLATLEGRSLEKLDDLRPPSAREGHKSHADRINDQLLIINPVCNSLTSIFESIRPEDQINGAIKRVAKSLLQNINVTRIRHKLLIYIAFGRNRMALFPSYVNCGNSFSALTTPDGTKVPKRGQKTKRGTRVGHNVDEAMISKMALGYTKHRAPGKRLVTIYLETLSNEFGCTVEKIPGTKRKRISHPESKPFPSEQQFRYHIDKIFTKTHVRIGIYGSARMRRKESGSMGAYTDGVAFIGERCEFDGQVLSETPRSFDGQHILEKLHSTTMIDVACGIMLGIGGGLGHEDSVSHNAMLFCAAIDKVKFCSLFGITIEADDWNCVGLPEGLFGDRGPGFSKEFTNRRNATLRGFGRSYQGQDKPSIETSHAKTIPIEGQPPREYSNKNPVEIFKDEILRIIAINRGSNVASRLTPEMVAQGVIGCPIEIHQFMAGRGRSMLVQIPFDDAVRRYLTKIKIAITADQAEYNHLRYLSPELTASGLLDTAKRHGRCEIDGYVLELCVGTIWAEAADGRLIELKFVPPVMENAEFLPMCNAESIIYNNEVLALRGMQRENAEAANLQFCAAVRENADTALMRSSPVLVTPGGVSKSATKTARHATGGGQAA